MKTRQLAEIANCIIFIKDLRKTELVKELSFTYTSLNNFLTRGSKMSFNHIEEIFKALNFPLSTALILVEKGFNSRLDLIISILDILRKEK